MAYLIDADVLNLKSSSHPAMFRRLTTRVSICGARRAVNT